MVCSRFALEKIGTYIACVPAGSEFMRFVSGEPGERLEEGYKPVKID